MIKVVAFDVFGTVVSLDWADRAEIKAYANHIRKPEWSPLTLPESWEHLPPHADSIPGIDCLRPGAMVVTCSNAPLGMMAKLSKNVGLRWDAIIPLELNQVFKPNPKAYLTVCEVLGVAPEEVLMVTANKDFGDIEGARSVGMRSVLIRHESARCRHIVDLVNEFWSELNWR